MCRRCGWVRCTRWCRQGLSLAAARWVMCGLACRGGGVWVVRGVRPSAWAYAFAAHLAAVLDPVGVAAGVLVEHLVVPLADGAVQHVRVVDVFGELVVECLPRVW